MLPVGYQGSVGHTGLPPAHTCLLWQHPGGVVACGGVLALGPDTWGELYAMYRGQAEKE